jgi:hypothetical protein
VTVQRVPEAPFAQIANAALRDKRLSFRARGILAMVLSHVGEWEASARWIGEQGPEGRDAIQTALNELTTLGYREVTQESTGDGGIRTVVVWRHVPEVADSQSTGNSTTVIPDGRETRVPKEHHPSEHHQTEHQQTSVDVNAPLANLIPIDLATAMFDVFWDVYPRHTGGKPMARKAWDKAVKRADPQVIVDGALRFREDPNRLDEFTPHPSTWLNQSRWTDDPLPARGGGRMSGTATYMEVAQQGRPLIELDWESA